MTGSLCCLCESPSGFFWGGGGVLCKARTFHESVAPQERESLARRQMLEEERRRREEAEKRLQDETFHRQQLVEKEVKMRAKNFSQVSDATR